MAETKDVLRPTDDEARTLARRLIDGAGFAAIGVILDGAPFVSRIALATTPDGTSMSVLSGLAGHTRALTDDPRCALLVGEPGERGDPLTHPRLSLTATARFIPRETEEHTTLRAHWLSLRPKSTVYVDLPDFRFVLFGMQEGSLNGGFGRAFRLTAEDLTR